MSDWSFEDDPIKNRWFAFGGYTGDECPRCKRLRLMECEDDKGNDRIICEKCCWEPAKNDFAYDALQQNR